MGKPIHILIIAQDIATYRAFAQEISERGWQVGVVGSFGEALTYLATDCPRVVMISYNHEDINLKNSPKILERRFGVQCVAFCERRAKNTAKLLLQSGLKNLLFPPITADAIFDKVSRMLRDKDDRPKSRKQNKNDSTGLNRPLFEDDSAGPKAKSGALFEVPPPQINIHDLNQEPPLSMVGELSGDKKTWYEAVVVPSLEKVSESFVVDPAVDLTLDNCFAGLPIRCDKFNGILWLLAPVRPESIGSFLDKLASELKRRMSTLGQKFSCGAPIKFFLRKDERFLLLSKTQNKLNWELSNIEWQSGLVPSDIMEPKTQSSKDQKIITIETCDIDLQTDVTFNLYIHLPKNKKFYLFVRKGRTITEKRLERLNATEHELFIQRQDLEMFRSYVFKNRLLRQLANEIGKKVPGSFW